MLIAGAVCPHPPLLIPDAAGAEPPGAFRKLLASCDLALRSLTATVPDLIVLVGGGPETREYPPEAAGGLQDYGIDVMVGAGEPVLPLSLTVGRWLLLRAGCDGAGPPVAVQAVNRRAAPAECLALGAALAGRAPRVALLAMGDGTSRGPLDIEGAPDPDAQEYDDEVAEALAAADARWLGRLDPATGAVKLVASPTHRSNPYGMVISSQGVPFFAEFGSHKIGRIDPQTMAIKEYALPDSAARPRRIAITSDDVIWYTDYARGYLGRLDPASGVVWEWPSPSGARSRPYGIAQVHDVLWYCETGVEPNTLVRFDPKTQQFQSWVIPAGGGVVRNMSVTWDGNLALAESGVNEVALVEIQP